jgi:hypothetical protein
MAGISTEALTGGAVQLSEQVEGAIAQIHAETSDIKAADFAPLVKSSTGSGISITKTSAASITDENKTAIAEGIEATLNNVGVAPGTAKAISEAVKDSNYLKTYFEGKGAGTILKTHDEVLTFLNGFVESSEAKANPSLSKLTGMSVEIQHSTSLLDMFNAGIKALVGAIKKNAQQTGS